jgi:hypothetical protein
MDKLEEIRQLYFAATRATIGDDFDRAIDLLKSTESDAERQRATVFMHGLAEMRAQWQAHGRRPSSRQPRPKR